MALFIFLITCTKPHKRQSVAVCYTLLVRQFSLQLHQRHECILACLQFDTLMTRVYTGCPRRNVPDFGRVFLRSNYTDITQNTYIQSSMVTEILAREKCGLLWCLRSILCPWCDALDLHRDNPAVACSSQRRPWLRNRCPECIVVGSQWTTMTRVRVFL